MPCWERPNAQNAIVERKKLKKVAVIRLGKPATEAVKTISGLAGRFKKIHGRIMVFRWKEAMNLMGGRLIH